VHRNNCIPPDHMLNVAFHR